MPNWCANEVKVEGSRKRLVEFDEAFKGRPANWGADLFDMREKTPEEKVLFELEHTKKIEAIHDYCFNALVPVPQDVLDAGFQSAGYEWSVVNWGTKWDASITAYDDGGSKITYVFDTAWSPPIPFLHTVSAKWPDLTFTLTYEEGGSAFAGEMIFRGGDAVYESSVDADFYREFVYSRFGYDPYAIEGEEIEDLRMDEFYAAYGHPDN